MPTFKPKNIKKIILSKKNITTLDGKHKEIIDGFTLDKKEQLPILQNEKQELCVKLKNMNLTVDERLDLCDRLVEIKKKIVTMFNKFLKRTFSIIFEYCYMKLNELL